MLNSHHFGHWIVLISPAWLECMTRYRTTNIASAFQPGGWCSDPPCTYYDHEWWSCSKASYFQITIHKVNQKGFPVQYLPVILIDSHCLHGHPGCIQWDQEYWAQTEPECLAGVPRTRKAKLSCSSKHPWY